MRNVKRIIRYAAVFIPAAAIVLTGCPQPSSPAPQGPEYAISVNKTAIAEIGPAGTDFSPAAPVTITIKNTGRKATGTISLQVIHTVDWVDGFWLDPGVFPEPKSGTLPSIQPGAEGNFNLEFLAQDLGPLLIQGKLIVSGGNAAIAAEIPVVYGRFAVSPIDVVTDPERLEMPASGEGSGTVSVEGGTEGRRWVSSSLEVAAVNPDTGALTLRKAGYTYLGYFPEDYESMNPLQDTFTYTLKGKKVQVHPAPGAHIVSAAIDGATTESAKQIKVTLQAPVTAESSAGFSVINDIVGPIALEEAVTVDGATLTLTMRRLLAWEEIQAAAIELKYASTLGNVIDGQNNPTPDRQVLITLSSFDAGVYGPPTVQSAEIDADRDGSGPSSAQAKKLYLTFSKPVKAVNAAGFTITGSRTAVRVTAAIEGSDTATLALTLNDAADESERANVKLHYNANLGNVRDAANEASLVSSFNDQAVTFKNYDTIHNADTIPPKIVSAVIEDASPGTVRVTFSEPVTVDAGKFTAKVSGTAWKSLASNAPPAGGTVLDVGIVTRTISAAAPASADSSVWDLTLSDSTQFGEIIRLAAQANAAADRSSNQLPEIPQFIVRSLVKRVKRGYEAQAGFYRNGLRDETAATGSSLYQTSLSKLGGNAASHPDHPQAREVIAIVLDSDQTFSAAPPWNSYSHVTGLNGRQFDGAMVIITTVTGNTQDFTITLERPDPLFFVRNNITLVIDEHVIVKRKQGVTGTSALVANLDGGKLILDGGELRENAASAANGGGGVQMGGGNYGAILLINGGKITGNQFTSTAFGNESAAGGINLNQYGIVVMHGGEISNNTLTQSGGTLGAASGPRAGGIAARNDSNQNHSNGSFYMTGGEIRGNKVVGAYDAASAGGVIVNGTFQKVGGTIYGSDHGNQNYRNTTEFTALVSAGAAAVINKAATRNPDPAAVLTNPDRPEAVVRDTTTGPDDTLFLDSRKSAHGSAGINLVPAWAESFWDSIPAP